MTHAGGIIMSRNAVDDQMMSRIDRAEKMRTLNTLEKATAELRGQLGMVTREKYESVPFEDVHSDGLTRMRTDQITKLYAQEKLDGHQYEAATKFRRVMEAIARGLYPGASPLGGMVGTSSRGTYRHPLERMNDQEFFVWFREYLPWAKGFAAKTAIKVNLIADDSESRFSPAVTTSQTFLKSYLQVCRVVIIDNLGPSQLEQKWPISRGKGVVVKALQEGLRQWKHVEYYEMKELPEIRRDMIASAKKSLDEVSPRKISR